MKYLIASANGYGNVGDELIALSLKDVLVAIDPNAHVRLTSPPIDQALVKSADVIIVGGGGLLYDYDLVKTNVTNYTAYLKLGHELKIPAYVIGVGEQGITNTKSQQVYRLALNFAQLVTTRSQADRDVLMHKVGVTQPVIALQDLVFALDFTKRQSAKIKAFPTRLFKLGKPRLAFNLPRLTNQGLDIDALGKPTAQSLAVYNQYLDGLAIEQLFADFKVTLVCQSRDDLEYYQGLQQRFSCPLIYPAKLNQAASILDVYRQSDLVLTGRFHGLILAAMLGKPTVSIGIAGQKLDKLITERLSSLAGSFYTVEQLQKTDFAKNLKQQYREGKIAVADPSQVATCRRLAELNRYFLEAMLLNDFGPRLTKKAKTQRG